MTVPDPAINPVARYGIYRVAALGVVAVLLILAWQTGVFELLGEPQRLRAALLDLGAWGWVAFVVAYTVLQPFGVPGTVFVMAAPLIWPWPLAFLLSMVGTMAASVVGFSFARFMARDFVLARLPAKLRKYESAMNERAFLTVVVLRFLLWMPQGLHAFFGVSRVGFWTHFCGSLLGYIPPLLATAYFGEQAMTWILEAPTWVWITTGVVLLTACGAFYVWRRRCQSGSDIRAPRRRLRPSRADLEHREPGAH
ncbi:MAG: VTT domain-containing protein [Myxococcales bacterium]|nr:VTT domain-containing protein [Myxococcales bacterium]